ncbi:hypothetical protein CMO93_00085 [Candidatus Woesearchaeota archaeon]|nr:hypothetical protein [Candidatus Woesearchaeota archaeon]
MNKTLTKTVLLILLITIAAYPLIASGGGEIVGVVLDSETNSPLPGANILVLNTPLGAAADADGYYMLLDLPVGVYDLKAQMIGYAPVVIKGVFVQSDLTTTQNVSMSSIILESEEEVVVEATRPLVQLDQTSSRRSLSSDDLQNMAISSVEDAVAQTAGGVEDASGNLHLRGGRSSETVYLFDGIPLNDPLTGNPNDSDIPLFGVEETSVITGGFGADYGNAQSGIINVTSRSGRNVFSGDVRISTSNGVSNAFANEDPQNFKGVEYALNGPIIKDKLFFALSGENNENFGRFENQYSNLYNYTGNLTWRISNKIKLTVSGLYSQSHYEDGFSYSWSHTLSEDGLTEYIPTYIKQYDGDVGDIPDGIMQAGEAPEYYVNWLTTAGLQTEDIDSDGRLDMYFTTEPFADWNQNSVYDEGEYFEDINGNGQYDNVLSYEVDLDGSGQITTPDGDRSHEDYNNNFSLDSEDPIDSWYGNGQLDTEDINGNGVLDEGEDINGNGVLDSEDVDKDGSLTTFSMFDRLPLWKRESSLWNVGFTHTLSKNTYYTIRVARYATGLESNIIERLNEDTDQDGYLDIYFATEPFIDLNGNGAWDEGEMFSDLNYNGFYDFDLDYDVDGDGDNRNEDLNGNGILDIYTPEKELSGFDDPQDMFHDNNHNGYVDESERDWDGNGVINELDQRYGWLDWSDIPDEGFKHTTGGFYGVGAAHPYTFNRDHFHYDKKVRTTFKFDFVSQINKNNKIETGLELNKHDLTNYWPPDRYGYAEHYIVNPIEFSGYIKDKMEYPGFTLNLGLRAEYFKPNAQYPSDETDPTWTSDDVDDWDGDGGQEQYKQWKDDAGLYIHSLDDLKNPVNAENKLIFAPRLGVSHHITDKAMLYFNYGRYYQRPALSYLFRNTTYNMGGGFPIVGNVNMDPEMTVAYEVGVRQELTSLTMVEAKGFYKNIFGLTDTRPIYWSVSDWYTTYYNRDYGNVRGFELILMKRPSGWFYGELNYTYSVAKGKSSSVGQGYLTEWSGNIVPTFESYLEWDQRHTFNANMNFVYRNFLTSFNANYGSGTRYTKPEQGRIIVENTELLPWYMDSNMRISYQIKYGNMKGSIFLYITNLFNLQRFRNVDDTDWYHQYTKLKNLYDSNNDGKVTTADGQENFFAYMSNVDLDHDGFVDENKLNPERGAYLHPGWYQDVRRFRIGISLSF